MTTNEYNDMYIELTRATEIISKHAHSLSDIDSRSRAQWFNIKDSLDEALDKLDNFREAVLQSNS